jgi:hypothetical protein
VTEATVDATTDRYGRPLDPAPTAERLETDPSQVHVILMAPAKERLWAKERGHGVAWHDDGRWSAENVVVVGGKRYGIGYCDDTSTWNQGPGLPRKQGRDAFLYGLSSVIDNHGGTGAEMQRLRSRGLVVEARDGDHLLLITGSAALGVGPESTLWLLTVNRYGYAELELVQR